MIHPNLGKRDLKKPIFYRLIAIISAVVTVIVAIVLWKVEGGA